jgi:hypothetical protein
MIREESQRDTGGTMSEHEGWMSLLSGYGEDHPHSFPLPAYSEFMPPPRVGRKPYGEPDVDLFSQDDPWGWNVSEAELEWELAPGLEHIAVEVYGSVLAFARGNPTPLIHGVRGSSLVDNPYWPPELASTVGHHPGERLVAIWPLALSRTQDDKGRVRWTLFGSSEQGPERGFWRSFLFAPGQERPADEGIEIFTRLLGQAYGVRARNEEDLVAAGFRILPAGDHHPDPAWRGDRLPSWTQAFTVDEAGPFDDVRFLVSFRPFSALPAEVRERYLSARLHLLPSPGTMFLWGTPTYGRLARELRLAHQIPFLRLTRRHGGPGIRITQSGWIREPGRRGAPGHIHEELLRETIARTHRWERVHRHEDEVGPLALEDRVARALFSTDLDAMGLYGKPMARNCQLWTEDFRLLLDGPSATPEEIERAREAVADGGVFGYRFFRPPMQVGPHEVFLHFPVIAFVPPGTDRVTVLSPSPTGYLTAYPAGSRDLSRPVELFPRVLRRPAERAAVTAFTHLHDQTPNQTAHNILKLRGAWRTRGELPLERSFARALIRVPASETLEGWLGTLPSRAASPEAGETVRREIEAILEPARSDAPGAPAETPLTYGRTATRAYEEAYWRDIAELAHGQYLTKDNADRVLDEATARAAPHPGRDLDALGDYLIERHRRAIAKAGMTGTAQAGEVPFGWQTDFEFEKFGGWVANREGRAHERNILVVIPGRDRRHAVVLADHYDTAYMEDVFDTSRGGSGARLAAHGADDNHSATATLLQAAPIYLDLAKQGKLGRDVWLLHLTGEEFPADCMGARAFCRALVEGNLTLKVEGGASVDLSTTRVVGLVVMDMIAHNHYDHPYVFQISPGEGPGAMRVAHQAHLANEAWNRLAAELNTAPERRGRGPSVRSADPAAVPPVAEHARLAGEVRHHWEPKSTLYNTDGQIFSDVGVPAVLFMEEYDINRQGYHDTHDTMENIDLDYGAAVSAIAIETVARLAVALDRES